MCNCNWHEKGLTIALLDFMGGSLGLFICSILLKAFLTLTYKDVLHDVTRPVLWDAADDVLLLFTDMHDVISGSTFTNHGFTIAVMLYTLVLLSALHIVLALVLAFGILRKNVICMKSWFVFKPAAILLTSIIFLILAYNNSKFIHYVTTLFITYTLFMVVNTSFLCIIKSLIVELPGLVSCGFVSGTYMLEDATAPDGILERIVKFLDQYGLRAEGLYRIRSDKSEVQTLLTELTKNPKLDIGSLNLYFLVIATALKELVSKKLVPPIAFPEDKLKQIEKIARIADRSIRLQKMKRLLSSLPPAHFAALRILFMHFTKVAEHSHANSMGSTNLAICWWPTFFPVYITDMTKLQQEEPIFKDVVQLMIDESQFLFAGMETLV